MPCVFHHHQVDTGAPAFKTGRSSGNASDTFLFSHLPFQPGSPFPCVTRRKGLIRQRLGARV